MNTADKSRRAFTFLVDAFLLYLLYGLCMLVQSIVTEEKLTMKLTGIWYVLIFFFYYLFFETIYQQTPGKMLSKTKVVRLDGTPPGFWQLAWRTLVRLSPFDQLSYLFGIGPGQHDYFSKTKVVVIERT